MSSLRVLMLALAALLGGAAAASAAPARVQMEEMTWPEFRDRIAAGATIALVPVGGTEQNGPQMALGKHNVRVRALAGRIAEQLGNAIVAPVLAYVPEGTIDPPAHHMRWPGTISVPEPVFEATLEAAARSLRHHGLCHVFFLGDHGSYRPSLDRVAARLNREWAKGSNCRAGALPEYYRAGQGGFAELLKARGYSEAEIGTHAGLSDTALMLAVDPSLVRTDIMAARPPKANDGVAGDPRRASAELGKLGTDHIVEAAVAAIRAATRPAP